MNAMMWKIIAGFQTADSTRTVDDMIDESQLWIDISSVGQIYDLKL